MDMEMREDVSVLLKRLVQNKSYLKMDAMEMISQSEEVFQFFFFFFFFFVYFCLFLVYFFFLVIFLFFFWLFFVYFLFIFCLIVHFPPSTTLKLTIPKTTPIIKG